MSTGSEVDTLDRLAPADEDHGRATIFMLRPPRADLAAGS
jgi:hypothetical protein